MTRRFVKEHRMHLDKVLLALLMLSPLARGLVRSRYLASLRIMSPAAFAIRILNFRRPSSWTRWSLYHPPFMGELHIATSLRRSPDC